MKVKAEQYIQDFDGKQKKQYVRSLKIMKLEIGLGILSQGFKNFCAK